MELTVNSKMVSRIDGVHVSIQPLIGAYELNFDLRLSVHPIHDAARWIRLHGVRVAVGSREGVRSLGLALSDAPAEFRQFTNIAQTRSRFGVALAPLQLAKIEDLRDGGDITFELSLFGAGGMCDRSDHDAPVTDNLTHVVPQSDWIQQLRLAGAFDILLLEIPLPSENSSLAASRLVQAHKYFVAGNYSACVAECRHVVEELGFARVRNTSWEADALKALADGKRAMTQEQREDVIRAALKHYTHQAHHSESDGGVAQFSRAEAKQMLHHSAVCLAFEAPT